jgi:hypothetical protein
MCSIRPYRRSSRGSWLASAVHSEYLALPFRSWADPVADGNFLLLASRRQSSGLLRTVPPSGDMPLRRFSSTNISRCEHNSSSSSQSLPPFRNNPMRRETKTRSQVSLLPPVRTAVSGSLGALQQTGNDPHHPLPTLSLFSQLLATRSGQ